MQKQTYMREVKQWLEAVDQGAETFQETRGWEILKLVQNEPLLSQELSPVEFGQIYAGLAYARFQRIGRIDRLVEHWKNKALAEDPANPLAHELTLESLITYIHQIEIPTKFPPIRETDHSSAKKKAAEKYNQSAKRFFTSVQEYNLKKNEAKQSIARQEENSRSLILTELDTVITKLKAPFTVIDRITMGYAESVTDVYYSTTQFLQIKRATKEIEYLKLQWDKTVEKNRKKRSEDTALEQLRKMIGLDDVKEKVQQLYQFLHYQKIRLENDFRSKDDLSLHMIFTGNPGTGKTHLARLIAKIYFELGLLEREEVYEVDRTQLVGAYVGQTEENTIQAIEKAKGGVLFIDEAYSLKRADSVGTDYGQTVIDTLVAAMTSSKFAGTFAVIMAGYPNEMRSFLRSNPGLRSRFPEQNLIHLPNYSTGELLQIGEFVAMENDYLLTKGAENELKKRIEHAQVDDSFGNARTVKNIILDAIFQKGSRLALESVKLDDFVFLETNDLKARTSSQAESGIDALMMLTGLKQIKEEIKGLISFAHIQRVRGEKGLQTLPLQLHAVFSGNPGTGKTTVAKLYAKALKEIGLLKRGHLITCSRADLVAGYVGQTATKTKEVVNDALGGVLFIDEAYSLVSAGAGDYGTEAINTLVQAMTEHKENIVVILAGYEDEMNKLLASNPGLRSRFKKYLTFKDYSKQELLEITINQAEQFGYKFNGVAKQLLNEQVLSEGHPANGRYAVNLFEKLVQQQSIRLSGEAEPSIEALQVITEEDVRAIFLQEENDGCI
ncbi:AAA family ATPase [bacterium LRH843]|nr:AAA family ATPase [bacterium LRH843]